MVGGKQQLKRFQDLTLKIEEDELSRESSYKYLGIIINENMTWGDHIASIQQKVAKRIGVIKRIGHLIPRAQRLTLVNTMMIPLFDYGDTIWGDRNNQCLMKTLQEHKGLGFTALEVSRLQTKAPSMCYYLQVNDK